MKADEKYTMEFTVEEIWMLRTSLAQRIQWLRQSLRPGETAIAEPKYRALLDRITNEKA